MERTRFEFQTGEDVEDFLRLLIGSSGVGGGLADEFGHRRGMMLGVKHFLDDATGVTSKGVAQAGFEPLG